MGASRQNPGGGSKGERRNSLNLNARDLGQMLDQFDAMTSGEGQVTREFIRWPFRKDSVQMRVEHSGGATATITVACRNLSRGGMSVLHNCYMHPGTKCVVLLPHPQRGEISVTGYVARCIHRAGVVHEVGVAFQTPLELRDLLRPDLFADWYSLEKVDPEELKGNVLYVDDSEIDVRIVKHFLRGTALCVRTAGTIAEALAGMDTGHDIIISDLHLPDGNGADLTSTLRQRGFRGPVVIATSDTGDSARALIQAANPEACLSKPLNQVLLHRCLGEFLIVRGAAAAAERAASPDAEASSLAQSFVASVPRTIKHLEAVMERSDVEGARMVCLQLAGTAPTLGFAHLGESAREAATSLDRTRSVAESMKHLRTLIAACERVRSRAA